MIIQNNITAINSYRMLNLNNKNISKNLEKLSSGYRVNSAADDASGLAISEKMRGQIRGLSMAEMNVMHGISLVQTAEGGLHEIHAILQRMRELAVQSANGIYTETDRNHLGKEYRALREEIDRIVQSTHFNGIKLLNGNLSQYKTEQIKSVAEITPFEMQRNLPIMPLAVNIPVQLTPPTTAVDNSAISIAGQTVTISGEGIFDITAYSGYDIIIKSSAQNVKLVQTGGQVQNVSIQCESNINLFVDNLNIKNTILGASSDKNIISFTGSGNTLNLIGTNNLLSEFATRSDILGAEKAIVHIGQGTDLLIQNADGENGILNVTFDGIDSRGAVIGSNYKENGGNITIASGSINAIGKTQQTNGAAIGTGKRDDPTSNTGTITILGGSVYAQVGRQDKGCDSNASAIGGGSYSSAGVINIMGGSVTAAVYGTYEAGYSGADSQGAAIGGYNRDGSVAQINISGGEVLAFEPNCISYAGPNATVTTKCTETITINMSLLC